MTSNRKSRLAVALVVVCLIAILQTVASTILLSGFAQVEAQDTQRNVQRATDALASTLSSLDSKTGDWANWDDAYQFVEDANPEFIQTNPTDASFSQIQINLIVFVNTSGKIVYAKAFDLDTQHEEPFPQSLAREVLPASPLLQHPDLQTGTKGIVMLPEGPMLVASRAILTSDGNGPSHGTLIFGRYLDAAEIKALAETTQLTLTVKRLDDPQLPPDFSAARSSISESTPIYVSPQSSDVIAGYTILHDTGGKPALLLRAELSRSIYAQAQTSTNYLLASLIAVGFVLLLVALKGWDYLVSRQETEKRYRAVVEQASEGIFILDLPSRRVLEANAAFQRLLGCTSGGILGQSIDQFVANRGEGSDAHISQSAGKSPEMGEQQFRRADRSPVDVEVSSNLIMYGGRQVSCVVVRDITERKRAERALRESEERYSLAVRGVNDGLWDWNIKTNELYYSPRWKSMLGWEGDGISSSPDEWFTRVHPDDRARIDAEIEAHLHGVTPYFQSEHRLRHRDGSYLWMLGRGLAVRDAEGSAYRMAGSLTDITARKRAEEQLLHDAFHDALTGLPNRALFLDRLGRAVERAKRLEHYMFAILYMDCDRFKSVNDSFGHATGDHLLAAMAQRLRLCLRSVDTVARLGGDEFVVLLEGIAGVQDAKQVAERIQSDLALPFSLDGHEVFTSTSMGIVLGGTRYQRAEEILRDADIAMYRAKALGKARYEMFDSALLNRTLTRLELENDMRTALDHHEFQLYYQPIMSLRNNKLTGFEALARWQHPHRGLIAPAEFIPIAEETGFIIPLGNWVLQEACRKMRELQVRFPCEPPLAINVNLSARQFAQSDLPEQIARIIEETGLDPHTLRLEITESVIMEDTAAGGAALSRLESLGVEVQIDDFGTGYSSLSYLQQFPINTLKIDRSFISEMSRRSNGDGSGSEIVQTIMTLARQLGLKVVAEGVETAEQLARLEALGCEYVQGYYFSRPLAGEKIEEFVVGIDAQPITLTENRST
jgi:diguanylate cyclase (GGDEF)-like protein/PAS domain S-box-containing protein